MTLPILFPTEYGEHRMRVRGCLDGLKQNSASDRAQAAAHLILAMEQAAGSRFLVVDGDPVLFTGLGRRLVPLDHKQPKWVTHLTMVYGLNAKDMELAPKVTSLLASHCAWFGAKMKPRRWSAYIGDALHLSRYDGSVMRITGDGVTEDDRGRLIDDGWHHRPTAEGSPIAFTIEDNGEHVLFDDEDNGSFPTDPVIGRNGRLFKLLQGIAWADTPTRLRKRHQVQALMIWMLAIAFADLFPTKPILMVEGAIGSGKSTLLQMIQQALFGSVDPFTVTDDGVRDFWVTLMRSPIMILDNTDDMIKWLPDQINAYTTKGYRAERKLHSNTGKVEIRPHGFIAVASQDPKSFRRGDTADRSIVLRMERRFDLHQHGGGESGHDIAERITADRNLIYGEWLYYLNRTVAAIHREPRRRTTTRLGDFEVFAYAAARALGWRPEIVIPDLMATMVKERAHFAAETDIVLDILVDWLALPANQGREITAKDLYKELTNMAEMSDRPMVKTAQALAQRLRAPHVAARIDLYDHVAGDRKVYQLYQPVERN